MFIKDIGSTKDVPYFLPAVSNRNYASRKEYGRIERKGRQGTGKGFGIPGLYHGVF